VLVTVLSQAALKQLAECREQPCASLYVPTHRDSTRIQEDRTRFKNLLGRAEELLRADGFGNPESRRVLAPALQLLDDKHFWQHQQEGLALFLSPTNSARIQLPQATDPLSAVGRRFYLKPLFRMMSGDGRFFILALSQNRVRLFDASQYGVSEVELDGTPRSLEDALGVDWKEKTLQFHTGSRSRVGGPRRAMYHGQGSGLDNREDKLAQFFRIVDDAVRLRIDDVNVPLVLAAVDYLIPIYRCVTRHPNLVDDGVIGNPDETTSKELLQAAWRVVRPRFTEFRRKAIHEYPHLRHKGLASQDLSDVLWAAKEGRVKTLFVDAWARRWGRVDERNRTVEAHDVRRDGDEELLDLAACEAFLRGATIHSIARAEMPPGTSLAALFRYRA
jgi:hypothetical protein